MTFDRPPRGQGGETAGSRLIAVAGNPNTGKTTLFNRLTGARQRVGNYPGITVEKTTGVTQLASGPVTLLDLPGTYSLTAASADERVVIDVLSGHEPGTERPDLVICVVDAANLRRNLFLASQIAETGTPMVLVLNMVDAATERGVTVDTDRLADALGVPVVATIASRNVGIDALKLAIDAALVSRPQLRPVPWPAPVAAARDIVAAAFASHIGRTVTDAEALRLLFDVDSDLPSHVSWRAGQSLVATERGKLRASELDPIAVEAKERYRQIDGMLADAVAFAPSTAASWSDRIDRLLTHRLLGLTVFAALMFIVFSSIYWLAQPLMDGVDAVFGTLAEVARARLEHAPMLQSLVVDGIITGVGGVVIFLPQILILFLFIAVLEDSGYMARAAFLMDRAFSWCGLNGKSFVPMLSSFACAVPSILSTRTIEDPKARLTTILVAPLMSCSARLPVYVLMIGAFIQPIAGAMWAGTALFAMHLVGLAVALPIAMLLNRWVVRGRRLPFVLEMPPYRLPHPRDVVYRMYRNGREFVLRAGTIILALSVVIWALTYFPRASEVRTAVVTEAAAEQHLSLAEAETLLETDLAHTLSAAYLENSYLGRAGHALQPLFAPAGFDWKLTIGVLASFPAREIIVSTLGIIYNVGDDDVDESSPALRDRLRAATWPDGRPVYTPVVALAVMIFFAFCMQCGSTVAVIARESGWRWATFSFVYMTTLAWVAAVLTYQVGTAVSGWMA